jgi:hypothetical protein
MISMPAIEPAISTLPVKNQLIAKVSRVPRVRQLIALRTDLECVSAPRNKATGALPLLLALSLPCGDSHPLCGCHAAGAKPTAIAHARQLANSLIWLSNCFPGARPTFPPWSRRAGKRWNDRQWKQYQEWDLRNVCGETRIVCHREWRKMAYFHLVGGGSRLDVNRKPKPAGAPLILTTVFNNPEAVSFGGNRLLEQA